MVEDRHSGQHVGCVQQHPPQASSRSTASRHASSCGKVCTVSRRHLALAEWRPRPVAEPVGRAAVLAYLWAGETSARQSYRLSMQGAHDSPPLPSEPVREPRWTKEEGRRSSCLRGRLLPHKAGSNPRARTAPKQPIARLRYAHESSSSVPSPETNAGRSPQRG